MVRVPVGEGREKDGSVVTEKTIEPVPVEIDEAALTTLGWTARDVRARLVTEVGPGGTVMQQLAVAGTVRFQAAARTEQFSGAGHAPHVLLTLGRHGSTALPSYGQAVAQNADVAAKRPIRFTETSETWTASEATVPEDLQIRLTGYDLDSIHRSFGLPAGRVTAIPVTVRDESTWPSLRVKAQASAEITHEQYGDWLRVHVEGIVEMGPVEQLLADRAAHDPGPFDRLSDLPRLPVPGFVVEVTDDSDFLLVKRTIEFHGSVTIDETTGAPRRAPRFVAGFRVSSASYAGTPTQVLLRVLDAADTQSI